MTQAARRFPRFTSFTTWQSTGGASTGITFTEIIPTVLTTQYAALGVTFPAGNDGIALSFGVFPLDGMGIFSSADGAVELSFSQPMTTIGVDYIGGMQFKLFSQGSLIYTSGPFFGFTTSHFAGLVSTQSFDAAILYEPDPSPGPNHIYVDSLYFGPPIPGPAALPLLVIGLLGRRRNRDG